MWNNCGPATITIALSYFGYQPNQTTAANWLKPNPEDKNVSPWQMAEFVNTQAPGTTRALVRYGGDLTLLKTLISNEFPVVVEAGYDPEPERLGWMGHYMLVKAYDDSTQQFITEDTYDGSNLPYSYDHIEQFWQHFNNVYLVLYDIEREAELMTLLGTNADATQNIQNALEQARQSAIADQTNAFAWFNMGSNFAMLGMYPEAAAAYDQARAVGVPWRMMWYQFGPFEAYNAVGRYEDTLALSHTNLNDGGGQYVEETYYYAGVAREGMGDMERAMVNYNSALEFNPNFTPAREARDRIISGG
jgi:tetratricopeptide (TPR) repeat protein